MTKIGVIGVGQMGSAIIKGLKKDATNKIIGENPVNPRVSGLAEKLDFKLVHAIHDLINLDLDYVFLTTPAKITLQIIPELINLDAKTTIISSVAGVGYNNLENILPNHSIIRIIPNTPVAINAGTIGLFIPANISKINAVKITHFLEQLGDVISVKEDQLSIVGTIGGCGPAFVDVFLDALGDAGVLNGLPRNLANQLAASMVKGSATLASDSKIAPALLRDQVCSPGGTTIKGVTSLEANGFRHAVIEAVNQANQN
ncbi:pyrroline-5-carboxylate reductase [Lactobacillus sp. A27]|uniref:pyrroline-5-carboxylate reductase n=1 Tax=Lactobacillus sp. A27 TaxID=2796363 RepID=UPI00191F10DB|nr:pyrroline-5-carboxylate reductase [Lactobacillus sp. A27]MBL1060446.1 pyrroline-5-carboxylate reductase [Lactobacillus sp. A27]